MNNESEDMTILTADFLSKQADLLLEKLKNAKTQKEKKKITNQLKELKYRIAYEITQINKIIEDSEEND